MLESIAHQQVQSGVPMISRLVLIQQGIESTCTVQPAFHPNLSHSPITKFNPVISDNSMFHSDMGFFVSPALALTKASKRDQLPASM